MSEWITKWMTYYELNSYESLVIALPSFQCWGISNLPKEFKFLNQYTYS